MSLNFDYVFIRDQGVRCLIPFIRQLSDETLIIAALCWNWSSVTPGEREDLRLELIRRYPHIEGLDMKWVSRWQGP